MHQWLPPQGPPSYMSPMNRLPNNDVPPDLLDEVRRRAGDDDRSLSSWIRRAVEHELERDAS